MLRKLFVICTFCAAMTAGTGVADAAGPYIDEVWMRYGGGRLYYNAVPAPIQMDTGGMRWEDPALIKFLPPIPPQGQNIRRSGSKSAPTSRVVLPASATGKPRGQLTTAKPAVSSKGTSSMMQGQPPASSGSSTAAPGPGSARTPQMSEAAARAQANGTGQPTGSLATPQNMDDFFVPPNAQSLTATTVSGAPATTNATSPNARTAGGGNAARRGQELPRPQVPSSTGL